MMLTLQCRRMKRSKSSLAIVNLSSYVRRKKRRKKKKNETQSFDRNVKFSTKRNQKKQKLSAVVKLSNYVKKKTKNL